MAQDITLLGASYSAVPAVVLPKTGGGSASFTDVTDTTAAAEDVAQGKYFYTAAGVKTAGTASGGGGWTTDGIANNSEPSGNINITVNIAQQAFQNRSGITGVTATSTSCGQQAFQNCQYITSVSMPNVTSCGTQAFYNCRRLITAAFPSLSGSVEQMLYDCRELTTVDLSSMTGIAARCFQNCYKLATLDLPKVTSISNNAFESCRTLATLILRHTSVVTLSNVNAFNNTPMRGYNSTNGTIYVPSSLISSYKTASNWSSIFGEGHVTFSAIEGSIYE